MAKKKVRQASSYLPRKKRVHRSTFMLTDEENSAIEQYLKKYKIKNKSKFMREAVLRTVMERLLDDYPTLFDKKDLDDLIV
ncbi:MAG: hypothetical protein GXO47_10680 [Chlorobi bacterium]|nr:hypothetical protein [Chlorobiota bacterium]